MSSSHDPIITRLQRISTFRTAASTAPMNPATAFPQDCECAASPEPSATAPWWRARLFLQPVIAWCLAMTAVGIFAGWMMGIPDRSAVEQGLKQLQETQLQWERQTLSREQELARHKALVLQRQTEVRQLEDRRSDLRTSVESLSAQKEQLLRYEGALPRFLARDGALYQIQQWPPVIQGDGAWEYIPVRRLPSH